MVALRIAVPVCIAFLLSAPRAQAQSAEEDFYKGYYLETEENNPEEAIQLYTRVARADEAPTAIVEQARRRLAVCREKVLSRDLGRLMPPDVLAYLEVRNPGAHLARIIEAIGLGGPSGPDAPFTISPRLIGALQDVNGAALALTDIDPRYGTPSGVVALNPGKDEVFRGLVETWLSAGVAAKILRSVEPVHGNATYLSQFGSVVVTERLVIAGNPHQLVVEAVERLYSKTPPSLSGSSAFAEIGGGRNDSLAFAFLNIHALLEKVKAQMAQYGGMPHEYYLTQAVTDIESIRWAALSLGTCEQGLSGSFQVRLAEKNRALAYHLLRTPSVGPDALKLVPAGAAGFLAFGLNEGRVSEQDPQRAAAVQYVTGLDFGREIFSNIQEVAAFVLGGEPGRGIPDAGIVLKVGNPARSRALWEQLLGIGATLMQMDPNPVQTRELEGHKVQVYALPENLRVCFAALPDRVVLASTPEAVAGAIRAAAGKGSVLDDPAFRKPAAILGPHSSKIIMVHAGRVFSMARPFMGIPDWQAGQIEAVVRDVTLSMFTDETPTALKGGVVLSLPNVGPMIQELIRGSAPPQVRVPEALPVSTWDAARVNVLLKEGSTWKYHDEGTDQGTEWREPGFDDSSWKEGPAPLGYGEDFIESTVAYGDDAENKRVTTYFRTTFTIDDPAALAAVQIRLRRDDGAAVYLNGKEVARDNLPPGAGFSTFSTGIIGGEAEGLFFVFPVPLDAVRKGTNVLAVEVHQSNGASSDVIFDLVVEGLRKEKAPAPPSTGV
jgi:hypothetical protein